MKFLAWTVLALCPLTAIARPSLVAATPEPMEHSFVLHISIPRAASRCPGQIVYGTYGHLNAAKHNAVLLPSHYMANLHGYEWLIGPGKALDPSRFSASVFL